MANSRFVSHIKWWFFFVPLIAVLIMPALPDRAWFAIAQEEADSVADVVGVDRADEAVSLTNARFKRWFVESGLVRKTMNAAGGSEITDGGMSDLAQSWMHNFWLEIYRVVYRATVMKLFILGTLVFCAAAFVDGTIRRKITASAAGFASPLSFHLAAHGILLVFGVSFAVLVLPFPIYAQCWIAVAAILGVLLWKAASSYQ